MINLLTGIFISAGFLVAGLLATAATRAWASHRNMLVVPSERCSHEMPTPHGGGIVISLLSIALGLFAWLAGWVPAQHSAWAFVSLGVVMMAIGVWDDFGHVSAKLRLVLHFMVAGIGLMSLPHLPVISFLGFNADATTTLMLWPVLLVSWVWLINLYNFMDGIDGLAGMQALLLFAGMALNFWYVGNQDWAWACVFMASVVFGFMVFNWPPAKIFMGDGGSGFLGFVIGFVALLSAALTSVSLWSWAILLTLFISDATATLVVRLLTGQNVLQAHRSHAYQILSRRLGGHLPVTFGYGTGVLLCLMPLSWLASIKPELGFGLFITTFAIACAIAYKLGCGRPEVV
jgi:Fuc2NAc and GlcNAc transferase